MISVKRASAIVAIGLLSSITAAEAGPQVIPGIGPQTTATATPVADQPGRYGGGFIEFLMTGHSAPSGVGAGSRASVRYMARTAPDGSPEPDYGFEPAAPQGSATRPQPGYIEPRKAVDPIFVRQDVPYAGPHAPGTVVIDTANKFLYLVENGGHALRYGIGVGRPGFLWAGEKTITRKAEWPDWTPPAEMLKRRPDLPGHMDGGITNPLGARAMYLGSSLYRIHGTNEPDTIGTNVSSGCIRLTNDDVTDLFGRVGVGTHVFVM